MNNLNKEWYASGNGFSSVEAMDLAHQVIVECVLEVLSEEGGNVIDFGSGNGALLNKLHKLNPKIIPYGVEIEQQRAEHVKDILPGFVRNFSVGSMFEKTDIWEGRRYSLAILMPGRLLEVEPALATQFRKKLVNHCDRVLVYAYGDWLEKYEGLKELAKKAGFIIPDNSRTVSIVTEIKE